MALDWADETACDPARLVCLRLSYIRAVAVLLASSSKSSCRDGTDPNRHNRTANPLRTVRGGGGQADRGLRSTSFRCDCARGRREGRYPSSTPDTSARESLCGVCPWRRNHGHRRCENDGCRRRPRGSGVFRWRGNTGCSLDAGLQASVYPRVQGLQAFDAGTRWRFLSSSRKSSAEAVVPGWLVYCDILLPHRDLDHHCFRVGSNSTGIEISRKCGDLPLVQ